MRLMVFTLLLPAFALQDNEAEKLFRGLEKKIAGAKTVRVSFEGKITGGKLESGQFKGSVALGEGDKARLEIKGKVQDMEVSLEMVSDGKKLKFTANPPGKESEKPLPKKFGATVRAGLSRVGLIASMLVAQPGRRGKPDEEPDLDKNLHVSDFKLGANARVEGRAARVVEYKVTLGPEKFAVVARLWLDAKTHLPLKRELSAEKDGMPIRIVESYSEFNLGEKSGKVPGSAK